MLLLLLLPVLALADCTPIENMWVKAALGEPADQADKQWCFAHAAANLLSIKLGRPLNAEQVAVDFHVSEISANKDNPQIKNIGGYVPDALRLALARGVCDANDPAEVVCTRRLVRGAHARGMDVKDKPKGLNAVNKILESGDPVAIGLNLAFLAKNGKKYMHAVTVVSRQEVDGVCLYTAVDSERTVEAFQDSYKDRRAHGFITLTAEELMKALIRLDTVTGTLSLDSD